MLCFAIWFSLQKVSLILEVFSNIELFTPFIRLYHTERANLFFSGILLWGKNKRKSRYKRGILAHFENNLDFWGNSWILPSFQVNLEINLDFKKTVFAHFQINLDFRATIIFHRWITFTISHSWVLKTVRISSSRMILFNDSLVAPSGCWLFCEDFQRSILYFLAKKSWCALVSSSVKAVSL